jgi:hypothetical protein
MTLGEFGSQCVLVRVAVTKPLGAIDPDEAMVPSAAEVGRGPIS